MKIIGINGSPRPKGNSATLLDEALRGAAENGAEVERIDIYKLNFKGCCSCFSCKRKGPFYGKGCAMSDDLTPVLKSLVAADGWVFASPIYNGHMSSGLSALLERLYFPYHNYDAVEAFKQGMLEKTIPSVLIYTMNGNKEFMDKFGLEHSCKYDAMKMGVFGGCEYMVANFTIQFDDYSKYHAASVPVEKKLKYHEEHFPIDLKRAYDLGKNLSEKISAI